MNMLLDIVGKAPSRTLQTERRLDEYVCWSRMQAEAGQHLHAIIARKELERRAGDGLFLWGVGNPPAVMARSLARADIPVRVVFSIMKSRPKAVDVVPSRTVVWRRYFDAHGAERDLPAHSLVTSRGDSAGGAKRVHYALMCHSSETLTIHRGEPFDPSAFRNAGGTGAPVGASQVTALLKRISRDSSETGYEANVVANLTASYWVRLSDPLELNADRIALLGSVEGWDVDRWSDTVSQIRGVPSPVNVRRGEELL